MKIILLYLYLQKRTQASVVLSHLQKIQKQLDRPFDYMSLSEFFRACYPEFWQEYIKSEVSLSAEYRGILSFYREHEKSQIAMVGFGEEKYPKALYSLEDPPLILYYRGNIECLNFPTLAVVGSREPVDKSLMWMEEYLLPVLQKKPMTLVSGGARGIDQKAHALSLRAQVPTVVVVPSGLNSLYPASLNEWQHEIVSAGGCILSEYEANQTMHKYLFHQRNRLIAALCSRVIIVEGKKKSGTLLTAQLALNLGKEIAVVPGHPLEGVYSGNLELLQDGAFPLVSLHQTQLFVEACSKTFV